MENLRSRLEAYCRRELHEPALVISAITPIPSGHSGFTYFVDTPEVTRRFVLRLPPPGARIAGPADVVRQGRIMRAVATAGVPVPPVPVVCEDPTALDGRPFILMEAIVGDPFTSVLASCGSAEVARSTVACLRRIGGVPVERSGIGSEAGVGLDAEMDRWVALMARGVAELTGRAAGLEAALRSARPDERAPSLVHGDYHYGNLLYRGSAVVGVLDWEIAQLGQRLLDLATLCVIADRRRFADDPNPGGAVDVTPEELVRLYGADPREMGWYRALGCYKYAAIFAYNLSLHRRGKRVDPHNERLAATIPGLLELGLELVSG